MQSKLKELEHLLITRKHGSHDQKSHGRRGAGSKVNSQGVDTSAIKKNSIIRFNAPRGRGGTNNIVGTVVNAAKDRESFDVIRGTVSSNRNLSDFPSMKVADWRITELVKR